MQLYIEAWKGHTFKYKGRQLEFYNETPRNKTCLNPMNCNQLIPFFFGFEDPLYPLIWWATPTPFFPFLCGGWKTFHANYYIIVSIDPKFS